MKFIFALSLILISNCLVTIGEGNFFNKIQVGEYDPFNYTNTAIGLLAETELKFFKIVKDFLTKSKLHQDTTVQRYIADFEETSLKIMNDSEKLEVGPFFHKVQTHPFLQFRMIWRFVNDFPHIIATIEESDEKEIKKQLKEIFNSAVRLPTIDNLHDSMESVMALLDTYDFDINQFTDGNFSSIVTDIKLSAIHCFEIAEWALKSKKYTLATAMEWLHVTNVKRKHPDRHPILDVVNETKFVKRFRETTAFGARTLPLSSRINVLCAGKNLQSEKEKSKLFCRLECKSHPYWYINPQKIEILSRDPLLYIIHNFVGNDVIKILKEMALYRFGISKRVNNSIELELLQGNSTDIPQGKKDYYFTLQSTSHHAWIGEKGNWQVERLFSKYKLLTGLKPTDRTDQMSIFRVIATSTGGYKNIHLDRVPPPYHKLVEIGGTGDYMASLIVYLNDVEFGGRTAFLSLGVSVLPVKGSAIFWYNRKRNGEIDDRTKHGGCPVVLGEKWTVIEWSYQNVNMFERKCSLDPKE